MTAPIGSATGSIEVSKLASDLHRMGAAARRSLRERMQREAGPLLAEARTRASWSTRIPGAITVRAVTDQTRGRVGVQLRVSTAAAPHARPYEGISKQGSSSYFRHPVYGNPDAWVSQTTRPFAQPAAQARGAAARAACMAALDDAARAAGFH